MASHDPFAPIHPGEILREEFLRPADISADTLATTIGMPLNRVADVIDERAPITAELALRFEKALGATAQFWMNLQSAYELELAQARAEGAGIDAIPNINPVFAAE